MERSIKKIEQIGKFKKEKLLKKVSKLTQFFSKEKGNGGEKGEAGTSTIVHRYTNNN